MEFNPYSISKISTWETCPRKFKLQYIDKLKCLPSDNFALKKGSAVHKILEEKFNYNIEFDDLTDSERDIVVDLVKKFEESDLGKKYKKLIDISVLEEDFAFNSKLELCGFWDKDAWCRGSADLYKVIGNKGIIVDWKTGKDHSNEEAFGIRQGTMYAIYLFLKYPDIREVKSIFVFVEHSTSKSIEFKRDNMTEYIKMFYNETKKIEADNHYKENITALCEYCDFMKSGLCDAYVNSKKSSEDFMNSKISLDF